MLDHSLFPGIVPACYIYLWTFHVQLSPEWLNYLSVRFLLFLSVFSSFSSSSFHSRAWQLNLWVARIKFDRRKLVCWFIAAPGYLWKGLCTVVFANRRTNVIPPTSAKRDLIKLAGEVLNIFEHVQYLLAFNDIVQFKLRRSEVTKVSEILRCRLSVMDVA